MNKKILLSVVASALLTTSAFAGTLTFGDAHARLSTESYMQNGLDAHNFGDLRYTFETTRASGSISDPLVTIDVTALEFPFVGALPDFDEDGKGVLPSVLATQDALITALENLFAGTSLVDVATGTAVALPFEEINVEDGKITIDFDGSSAEELKNGHIYQIVDAAGEPVDVPYKFQATPTFGATPTLTAGGKMLVDAFSQTLDSNVIDHAEDGFVPTLVNQFSVACVRKFDGLINFENDRTSFVNPEHGERAGDTDADTNTDTMINNDRMIFTIDNARAADANATRWMSGASSEFTFNASNTDNDVNFAAAAVDANLEIFAAAEANNFDTKVVASVITGGTFAYAAQEFLITYPPEAIKAGLTTFEVNLPMAATVANPLRPVQFTDPAVDLEQGVVVADEVRSDIVEDADVDGTFVENNEDNRIQGLYPHIAPQNQTTPLSTDVGEWMDHSYIAQIAGATQNPGVVESKFFIVNRSCAPVTPKFKLIQDGEVVMVTGPTIAVDSQAKVTMATLLADPAAAALTGKQFAVEIIIGGVAEDFYVYAQSLTATGATKDLPVYNTSNRD